MKNTNESLATTINCLTNDLLDLQRIFRFNFSQSKISNVKMNFTAALTAIDSLFNFINVNWEYIVDTEYHYEWFSILVISNIADFF